ncbi:MAG: AAA family ATPase [Dokdonella sp.]
MEYIDTNERLHARATAAGTPRRPLVVAVMGLPGAGKTTVARALERELGLRRVCRDSIRRALFPRCNYSFVEKRAAFRSVLLALEINCLLGEASVVDGITFSRRQDFDQIEALATAHGFDTLPLLIDCPPPLARARFVRNELARRLGDEARDESFVEAFVAHFQAPPLSTLRIDGSLPNDDMCRLAVVEIAARLPLTALT